MWIDVIKYNMDDLRFNLEDVENRAEWKWRIRVADPSPEGSAVRKRGGMQRPDQTDQPPQTPPSVPIYLTERRRQTTGD